MPTIIAIHPINAKNAIIVEIILLVSEKLKLFISDTQDIRIN